MICIGQKNLKSEGMTSCKMENFCIQSDGTFFDGDIYRVQFSEHIPQNLFTSIPELNLSSAQRVRAPSVIISCYVCLNLRCCVFPVFRPVSIRKLSITTVSKPRFRLWKFSVYCNSRYFRKKRKFTVRMMYLAFENKLETLPRVCVKVKLAST